MCIHYYTEDESRFLVTFHFRRLKKKEKKRKPLSTQLTRYKRPHNNAAQTIFQHFSKVPSILFQLFSFAFLLRLFVRQRMTDVSFYAALKHFTQTQKIGGNPMKAQQRFFSFSRHGFHFLLFLIFSIYLFPENCLSSFFHLAGRCCYTSAEQLLRVSVRSKQ